MAEHTARPRPVAGVPAWAILAVVAVVTSAALAWIAGGVLTRRAHAARLPAVPDLSRVSVPVGAAVLAADAAARRAPGSADAVGALGMAYHGALMASEAIAAYAVAESVAPDAWVWTYRRALLLEERGQAAATRAALERVTTLAPSQGHAWFRLAEQAFKEGRLDDAGRAYTRARDATAVAPFTPPRVAARQTVPLSAYADLGLARLALERGDTEAAARRLRAIVDSYPAFGPARTMLRQVERRTTTSDSGAVRAGFDAPYVPPADPLLDQVVAESSHSDLLLKHASQATRAGDGSWREYLVRRALSVNPDDLNVLIEMAAMLQAAGQPAEALVYLERHEALAPNDHHTLVEQGRSLIDLGRLDAAEAVLRRAVVVRDAAAEFNLGVVLDQRGRWDEAQARYQRALEIDPFHTRAMNNLGVGLDRRGQSPAAVAYFERALDISPGSAEFLVNYGSALIQLGRLDEAVRVLTQAVGIDPRSANAHNNLGIARVRQGDLPRALTEFERAVAIDPRHDARSNLEQVRRQLGGQTPFLPELE